MKVELLSHTDNPEETIERAARICYDSKAGDEEKRKKFLTGLIKSGHTATIEHASATFEVSEVSRALLAQITRHRLVSFCVRSQRYCKEDGFITVIPDSVLYGKNGEFHDKWVNLMKNVESFYNEMVEAGIPKEDARYILPNACFTKFVISANFREWRHFLELRLSPRAQWEIRSLAKEILKQLYTIAPIIFGDLYEQQFGEGLGHA